MDLPGQGNILFWRRDGRPLDSGVTAHPGKYRSVQLQLNHSTSVFRDGDVADIGYAMVCYPDYAVAKGLNPKLQLLRTKTLMQGDESCSLRYVMEAWPDDAGLLA